MLLIVKDYLTSIDLDFLDSGRILFKETFS